MDREDGNIVNPDDLDGRVLATNRIELTWDGNQLCALAGPDLVVGVSGFGDSVHDALRELADNLVREAVWIEVPEQKERDLKPSGAVPSGTIQANGIDLYRIAEGRIGAVVSSNEPAVRIAGTGQSAHEALRALADELVLHGVWIEVTARREWHFEEVVHLKDQPEPANTEAIASPLSFPPRCRGVPLEGGSYSGCAYGSGELRSLTGPCDQVCHGSGFEGVLATMIPHSDFGDPDCCGMLYGIIRGDVANIECNECEAVIRAVPPPALGKTLGEMELTLGVASEICPHCGNANLFPGFSEMKAYACRHCGELVRLMDGPDVERFFGPEE